MSSDDNPLTVSTTKSPARSKGGVGILTIGEFGGQATRLVTSIIVAQLLGPSGRGAVALISVLDEVSTAVLTAGIPVAAGFHAKLKLDSDKALINASVRAGLFLLPLTTVVAVGIGVLFLSVLEPAARWLTVLLIAWTSVISLPSLSAMNILQAHRKLRNLATYSLLFNLLVMALVLGLALSVGLSVAWVALAFAIGRVATALYGLSTTAWPSRGPSARLLPLARYGLKALAGSVGSLLNNKLDQLLIAPMVTLSDLGLYAVAAGASFPPTILAMSMSSGAFATVSHDTHLGRRNSAATAIRRALLVSAFGSICLACVAPILIPLLYGSAFTGAVVPTIILLAGSIPWGAQLVAAQCANGLGQPSYASISETVGLCVTVVGLLVFVPLYGIVGASLVSVAAYAIRLVITLALLRRIGVRHFVPGRDDVHWLTRQVHSAATHLRTS